MVNCLKNLKSTLPDIAVIIKKMLLAEPFDRPCLETISHNLKLPIEINTELSGNMNIKKEDTEIWVKKYINSS